MPRTKGPFTVGHDGLSRPIIHSKREMLSISKFRSGLGTAGFESYDEEEADCAAFVLAWDAFEALKLAAEVRVPLSIHALNVVHGTVDDAARDGCRACVADKMRRDVLKRLAEIDAEPTP